MPRPKQPSAPTTTEEKVNQLTEAIEHLAEELQATREDLGTVRELTQEARVLRDSIDDARQEIEWIVRNMQRPAWAPTPSITSMPKDPLAEDFHERVNRFTAKDLPPDPSPSPPPPAAGKSQQGDLFE